MLVLPKKALKDFYEQHSDSKAALLSWYRVIHENDFETPAALRATFGQVDYVKGVYVFNIGLAYRLIARIDFAASRVYIARIMTHREYDRGKWKPQ